MSLGDWTQLIILSILWGGSFFFIEVALKELLILTIVFLRVFLGGLFLFIISLILRVKLPKDKIIWRDIFIMSILNNVIPMCLIVGGQSLISGGMASILNATTPLFAALIAHKFTIDEKISIGKIAGVIIGFVGVAVLLGYKNTGNTLIGQIMILLAAVSYAIAGVWGRRFKSYGLGPIEVATGQLICSSSILLIAVLLLNKPWTLTLPGLETWGAIAGLAILSTTIGYLIYFNVLGRAGATNVLLVTLLIPISAIFLGVTILKEVLEIRQLLGMCIITLGLLLIDGRLIKSIEKRLL